MSHCLHEIHFLFSSLNKYYTTAVLGSSSYSSVWIKSPYEQIIWVDGIKQIPDTDLDLLHLASPVNISRGVTPLDIQPIQPLLGVNHTCYAIGYSDDRTNKTEITLLRPDPKCSNSSTVCFAVSRKPHSCSVSIII